MRHIKEKTEGVKAVTADMSIVCDVQGTVLLIRVLVLHGPADGATGTMANVNDYLTTEQPPHTSLS